MDWWLIALLFALALLVLVLLLPIGLSISLQARGAADGNFAAAGGAQLGPLTATLVVARDVPLRIGVSVFGRQLKRSLPAPKDEPSEPTQPRDSPPWLERLRSKIGLSEVLDFLLGRQRWIGLDGLDVDVDYSSKNVALTGQILAVMCVASALLPSKVTLHHHPSWELADRASLSIDGRFRLWPALFVCDSLWFLVRTVMLPKRPDEDLARR